MNNNYDNKEHIGRLARRPYLGMIREVYAYHEENGHHDVKSAHSVVFMFIGKGARITDMAGMANTSKQNMKYLVEYLEERGYVERKNDQTDGRARIFYLTKKGEAFKENNYKIIEQVEAKWAAQIGREKMDELKSILSELGSFIMKDHGYL